MKVSIVTTVFNRRQQFLTTLKTIALTQYPHDQFEVRVVDDAGEQNERVDDLVDKFDYKIHLRVVKFEEKTWQEPITLINRMVYESEGEIVIIQNGECCHVGDIISYAAEKVEKGTYLTFGSFNVDAQNTALIQNLAVPDRDSIMGIIGDPPRVKGIAWREGGQWWYNHSVHRPEGYYFCSAMMKQDYINIGGINEAFANGIYYADTEFMRRVFSRMKVVFVDDPFTVHQHHSHFMQTRANYGAMKERNKRLFVEIISREGV